MILGKEILYDRWSKDIHIDDGFAIACLTTAIPRQKYFGERVRGNDGLREEH